MLFVINTFGDFGSHRHLVETYWALCPPPYAVLLDHIINAVQVDERSILLLLPRRGNLKRLDAAVSECVSCLLHKTIWNLLIARTAH